MNLKKEINKTLTNDKKKIPSLSDINKVTAYFTELYRTIQKKIAKSAGTEFDLSGTCSISVLIINTKMYTINLGDSRCVLGMRKITDEHHASSSKDREKVEKTALEMSIDHKPSRDDEQKRISEKGGEVSDTKIPGAYRVFRKNDDIPGLAVTRSIGDIVAHECGVSCDPEILEKSLNSNDQFIVVASDGVYDVLSSSEVVGFIFEAMDKFGEDHDKNNIAQMLCEECRRRWEALNMFKLKYVLSTDKSKDKDKKARDKDGGLQDIDDITCIIDFITVDKEEY